LGTCFPAQGADIVPLDPYGRHSEWLTGERGGDNEKPTWSTLGDLLIFTKDDMLYTIVINWEVDTQIESPFSSSVFNASWFVNGELLAVSAAYGQYPQVWKTGVQDTELEPVPPRLSFQFDPVWSPDGSLFLFFRFDGVVLSE
jgi:Tol biopolymer transport system component